MRRYVGLCAGAVLGLAVSAIGCGGSYQTPPESGSGKGNEMKVATANGQPIASNASSMAQTPPAFNPPPSHPIDTKVNVDAGTD